MQRQNIIRAFTRLGQNVQAKGYKGYEFDDFLASPLVRLFTFNNLYLQRIGVQIGKICSVNIRPLIGVPRLESTKARGFFAKGYLYYYLATQDPHWLRLAEDHLEWLMENPAPDFPGMSWGNAFDFAGRGGFIKKNSPTVVWTAHIAEAFEMAYTITGNEKYLSVLQEAGRFIVTSLERHQDERGICFAYAPGLLKLIHNSNLLGAATLLRCWRYSDNSEYHQLARQSYQWSISHINSDGSWSYGEEKNCKWVDSFHTAYNLDSLIAGYDLGGKEMVPLSIIDKTYRYWIDNFFLEDGTPKYYNNSVFPLDIQCASQAIESLSKHHQHFPKSLALANQVVRWTIGNMQKSNGAFIYQIRPYWKNKLECIHWGQATMLSALGAYLYYSGDIKP